MDIRINGKTLLAVGILSVSFAFGDAFVSIVDKNSGGGINLVKEEITESKFDTMLLAKFPVGTVILRMDSVDPSTIYGGTWQRLTGDASLAIGNGGNLSGQVYGENEPLVPLPAHSHGFLGRSGGDWNDFLGGSTASYGMGQGSVQNGYATAEAGESGAKLNVRGARIDVNVWKRIS